MYDAKVHPSIPNGNHIVFLDSFRNHTSKPIMNRTSHVEKSHKPHKCDSKCEAKYPLHWAARQTDYTLFEQMFSHLAKNPKEELDITESDCDGATILIRLSDHNDESAKSLRRIEDVAEWFILFLEKEVDSSDKLNNYVNIQDSLQKSALHYIASTKMYMHGLVSSLLGNGADPSLTDHKGRTPLHNVAAAPTETDETLLKQSDALKTAKLLVESMPNKDILDYDGRSPLDIAMYVGQNAEMVQLLLDHGCSPYTLQVDKDTGLVTKRLILHHAIEDCKDDNVENVECIKRFVKVLSKEELNAKYESTKAPNLKGKTALHTAAHSLCPNVLKVLLEVGDVDLFILDDDGRTALHILANFGWNHGTNNCVDILLDRKNKLKILSRSEKLQFFNLTDNNGETALDITIRRDSAPLSKTLILDSPHPDPESWVTVELMERIYYRVPEALIPVMEQNINFDNKNYEATDETFSAHIGPITGFGCNESKLVDGVSRETDLLALMLHSPFVRGTELENVLGHPLVQIFIMEKWKKLRSVLWCALVTKFVWIGFYLYFVIDVLWVSFPHAYTKDIVPVKHEIKYLLPWHFVCGVVLVCLTILIFFFKTLVTTLSVGCRKAFRVFSAVHLVFSISICTSTILLCVNGVQPWLYVFHGMNVILASFIGMWELRNMPVIGIYADIFFTVTKNLVLLMIAFIPLLIGFTITISLMLRGNKSFSELNWNLIKTLIMMLGEINFNTLFYSDPQSPFRPYAILVLTLFVICIPIVMFNLLLGFTISDVQALEAESEHKVLISTLESIILLERIVLSPQIQKLIPKRFLWSFVLATKEWSQECEYFGKKLEIRVLMGDLPAKVRERIRQIAKEQLKLSQEQGKMT